jgi:protein-L-isoaspartate(D-aspartate) O-methyltransferase
VLSRVVQEVYSVEQHAALAELAYDNVHIRHGDGTLGWPEHAPYDGIVVGTGGPKIPDTLRQ